MSSLLPVLTYGEDSSDEDSLELDDEIDAEASMLATAAMSLEPTTSARDGAGCCPTCKAKRHRAWWWIVPSVFMEVFAAGAVRAIVPVVIVAYFKVAPLGYLGGGTTSSDASMGGGGSFLPTGGDAAGGSTTGATVADHRDAAFFFVSSAEALRVILSMAIAPFLASVATRCSRRLVAVISALLAALPFLALSFGPWDGSVYVYFAFLVISGLGASSDARSLEYIRARTLSPVVGSKRGCGVRCTSCFTGGKSIDFAAGYAVMNALGVGAGFAVAPLIGVILYAIAQNNCWLPFMLAFLISIANVVYLGAVLPTQQLNVADAQAAANSEGGRKWWRNAAGGADASCFAKARAVCGFMCAGPVAASSGAAETRSSRALAVVYGAHTCVAAALDCTLLLFAHIDLAFTPLELALLVAFIGLCTIAVETLPELFRRLACTGVCADKIASNPCMKFFGLDDGDGVSFLRAGGLSDNATVALGIGFSLCQTALLAFAVEKWVLFAAAPLGALAVMVPRSVHLLVQKKTSPLALPATLATLQSAHAAASCASPAVMGALFTMTSSSTMNMPTVPFLALTLCNIVAIIATLAYYDGVWKEELQGPSLDAAVNNNRGASLLTSDGGAAMGGPTRTLGADIRGPSRSPPNVPAGSPGAMIASASGRRASAPSMMRGGAGGSVSTIDLERPTVAGSSRGIDAESKEEADSLL